MRCCGEAQLTFCAVAPWKGNIFYHVKRDPAFNSNLIFICGLQMSFRAILNQDHYVPNALLLFTMHCSVFGVYLLHSKHRLKKAPSFKIYQIYKANALENLQWSFFRLWSLPDTKIKYKLTAVMCSCAIISLTELQGSYLMLLFMSRLCISSF